MRRLPRRACACGGSASPARVRRRVLILFDIDGTLLLRAHLEHREALADAVREVWGVRDPGPDAVRAAGRTDGEIAREICVLGGVAAERLAPSATRSGPRARRPTRAAARLTCATAWR